MNQVIEETKVWQMMGTTITLQVGHEKPDQLLAELDKLLHVYEHRFSAHDATSELMAINRAAGQQAVVVHPELFELIKVGKEHSCVRNSYLNIAIGPVVQKWHIGFEDALVPTKAEIAELLPLTDPHQIQLDEQMKSVFLTKPGMMIDLGSLAKGYIADKLVEYCRERKAAFALVNLGGNIVVFGEAPRHPDGFWRIGLRNPKGSREDSLAVVKLNNQSLVTSGIYERYLQNGSSVYHHIIDPKTGFPVKNELASLTILSDSSVDGEIWTTRLFGASASEVLKALEIQTGIEGAIVTKENQFVYTSGFEKVSFV
ncbi:FAD:protein FMN transferase [Candidatus Enterococcus courvalinii]|uniref:FAD:protein FMN transferase n=1 Tax=Candidatus Enterococcus courvalinii TaxID=2815329 RepID=A0ABS3I1Z4_9ENTE|nr:FAD:protein FMN transferase [Enterococcus sp. MSG2901]MBO0482729.1 FAD:protein FMN transferase [Enterococcus sp. MSG2901]